ncbi:hypothetical protein AGLY_007420 [Aphis glycines]|uniref:Uncharacterized protein n=1 Tax=Aphis glycines TaxID=307491 RepID=A0A6G0TNK3_APHGL|nr:hypothetical protein AGLY_007420 [Aphis glycines]
MSKTFGQKKNKEGNEVIVEENEENYNSEDALSSRKLSIQIKRNESVQNLEKQANKMKSLSERRFCEGNIGDSVKIKIPDVDRARSDLRSILAVIISMEDGNYKLGTTKGKLQHYYSRNQFTICKEKFVSVDEVPDIQLSLREAARLFSNLGGQGYDRCTCVQKCETRRCKCKAAGILCNSKCHSAGDAATACKNAICWLSEACDSCIPRSSSRRNNRSPVPWWNPAIAEHRKLCIKARSAYTRKVKKAGEAGSVAERQTYKDQRKALTIQILEAKENWNTLCAQVDNDPWGLPYKIVMRKLNRRKPIPGLEIPGRLEGIIETLFPKRTVTDRSLLTVEEDELYEAKFTAAEIRVLTGRGCFNEYQLKYHRRESGECTQFGATPDSVEHAVFACDAWHNWRREAC